MKVAAVFILGLTIGFFLPCGEDHSKLTYGKSGLPRSCRAIIKTNVDGVKQGKFSKGDALDSIDRNCGEFGLSW
jgi:hypothetical protein